MGFSICSHRCFTKKLNTSMLYLDRSRISGTVCAHMIARTLLGIPQNMFGNNCRNMGTPLFSWALWQETKATLHIMELFTSTSCMFSFTGHVTRSTAAGRLYLGSSTHRFFSALLLNVSTLRQQGRTFGSPRGTRPSSPAHVHRTSALAGASDV